MNVDLAKELKHRDYDKYLALVFAPSDLKQPLAALFTFHLDVSAIPAEISEPMVGHVKIQWWRDVITEIIEGKPSRPHPVLLALKEHDINYSRLLKLLHRYDEVIENKLPERFEELEAFLLDTEVAILELAAGLTGTSFNPDIALAYAYNSMARQLKGKNDAFSAKFLEESRRLLPEVKSSVFGGIAGFYNKKPAAKRWQLALSLLAGRRKLL
jgi:hypothetical protein